MKTKSLTVADLLQPVSKGLPKPGRRIIVKRTDKRGRVKHPYVVAHLIDRGPAFHQFINAQSGAEIREVTDWAYIDGEDA